MALGGLDMQRAWGSAPSPPGLSLAASKRDCLERFGPRTLERITRDDDVICTTEYSRIVPLENGEVGGWHGGGPSLCAVVGGASPTLTLTLTLLSADCGVPSEQASRGHELLLLAPAA